MAYGCSRPKVDSGVFSMSPSFPVLRTDGQISVVLLGMSTSEFSGVGAAKGSMKAWVSKSKPREFTYLALTGMPTTMFVLQPSEEVPAMARTMMITITFTSLATRFRFK